MYVCRYTTYKRARWLERAWGGKPILAPTLFHSDSRHALHAVGRSRRSWYSRYCTAYLSHYGATVGKSTHAKQTINPNPSQKVHTHRIIDLGCRVRIKQECQLRVVNRTATATITTMHAHTYLACHRSITSATSDTPNGWQSEVDGVRYITLTAV